MLQTLSLNQKFGVKHDVSADALLLYSALYDIAEFGEKIQIGDIVYYILGIETIEKAAPIAIKQRDVKTLLHELADKKLIDIPPQHPVTAEKATFCFGDRYEDYFLFI